MADETPPAGKRSFLRPALIVLGGLAATLLAVWVFRLPLVNWAIPLILEANGIAPVRLTLEKLEPDGIAARDIAIGPDGAQRIGSAEASFSLSGLKHGEIARVWLSGATLRGSHANRRLNLPGLNALFEGESDGPAPIRVAELVVEDSRIELDTSFGKMQAGLGATVATEPDGLIDAKGGFGVHAAANEETVHAKGRFTVSLLAGGEMLGRVDIEDAAFDSTVAKAASMHGGLQFFRTGEDVSADLSLVAGHAEIDGNPLTDGHLTAGVTLGDTGVTVDALLAAVEGSASLTGKVQPDETGVFHGDADISATLDLPTVTAHLKGSLEGTGTLLGKADGKLEIAEAAFALAREGIAAGGISGTVSVSRDADAPPDGDASLSIGQLTLPGLPAAGVTVTLQRKDGTLAGQGHLASEGGTIAVQASLPPSQPLGFTVSGSIVPGAVPTLSTVGLASKGTVAIDLSGSLADPLGNPATIPQNLTVHGKITPDLQKLHLVDTVTDGALQGPVTVDIRPGLWRFTSPSIRLAGIRLDRKLLLPLPEALRPHGAGPIHVELRATDETAAELRIVPAGDGYDATLSGMTRIAAAGAVLTVTGITELALPAAVRSASGRFRLNGAVRGPVAEGFAPATLRPDLAGDYRLQDNVLSLTAETGGKVAVEGLEAPGSFRADSPLVLRIDQPLQLRAALDSEPVALTYSGGATLLESRLAAGSTTIAVSPVPLRINGDGGHLNATVGPALVDTDAVSASGITATITADETLKLDAAIARISHTAETPAVVPLRLAANATLKDNLATFTAQLRNATGAISINATGSHDLAAQAGSSHIESDQVVFLPTVLQPRQLFPALGNAVQEINGDIDGKADFEWSNGELQSSGELLANIAVLKAQNMTLESAATIVTFDSLVPPSTPPQQEIQVGLLDIGIPLTKGRIEFQLNRDGAVTAALRELDMFGGRIETETFRIPAQLDGFTVPLQVNGVPLDELLVATQVGDLTATGTLNGRIPVTFEKGNIVLRNGFLETGPGGGRIQYRPQAVGPALSDANEGTALFLDIVRDFQYDSVQVAIDEQPDGEVPFEFKIKGRNQTVYNGIPVELNLSMSGPLRALLQQGLKTYTLPDRLLERMQEFHDQ
jgi:hypothetical protein